MADELKPPVAIRITRPYATEAEFLEREFDTLTHTSVVLLGAQARPQGVVLRFEIVLKTGESMLRGEGRVVGYKEKAYLGEPGLSLRFTRLDSRSKTLVDRASSLREARVRASTSLMGMPAVVVPRAPSPIQVPPAPSSGPSAVESSPRLPTPVPARPSSPPPPSRRVGPPALPGWAKLGAPRPLAAPPAPPSPVVDVESTQVDAHFDLEPPKAEPPTREFAQLGAAPEPDRAQPESDLLAELPPIVAPPAPDVGQVEEPLAVADLPPPQAPARVPFRPTPARPPPLPRSVPPIPRASSVPPPLTPAPSAPAVPAPARVPAVTSTRGGRAREGVAPPAPTERNALLLRLRQRADALPRARVEEILTKRAR